MIDLAIYETGQGGDARLLGNDLEMTEGLFNMPYIGLFGGNPGYETTGREIDDEQKFDWWGNSLLFGDSKAVQFNSSLENALNTTALNSAGRIKIEDAIRRDLSFLDDFATVTAEATITSDQRIAIDIKIQEPDNLEEKEFQFIWDKTREEVITNITL